MRTLDSLEAVEGERVLVRVDFNVPLDGGRITDDARIRAALPTLTELREKGAALVLAGRMWSVQICPSAGVRKTLNTGEGPSARVQRALNGLEGVSVQKRKGLNMR